MSLIPQASGFARRLETANEEAKTAAGAFLSGRRELYSALREYLRVKYLLLPEDMTSDSFEVLGQRSLERVSRLSEARSGTDISPHCGNVSSAIHKKILLLIAIRRDFGVEIEPHAGAACETVRQLSELMAQALQEGR